MLNKENNYLLEIWNGHFFRQRSYRKYQNKEKLQIIL